MTARQRLLTVMRGEVPDCVPVCPDISNMVPAKLTGKPFWDIYIYRNPPLWKAYVDAVKFFDLDGGFDLYDFGDLFGDMGPAWERKIVRRNRDGTFISQEHCAAKFRCEHARRARPRLFQHDTVIQDTGRVNDSLERRFAARERAHEFTHRDVVCDVNGFDLDMCPCDAQSVDRQAGVLVRRASTHQYHIGRPARQQPPCRREAERTQATGDEIRAVSAWSRR